MLEETHSISASFVATALLHEIVSPRDAERIAAYAEENSVSQSEAALDLTVLSSQQVDAVRVLLRPTNLAPGYQIKSLLGCGAMGMVFRARQASLDRDVALKTILLRKTDDQRERARFQREAHAIARLQHPHIVAAYDAGIHEGRAFIAMELVDGEDLASRLRSRGVFSEGEAWRIARQVAEALAHADAMGIVHRDVKPANIMLARNAGGGESDAGPLIAKVTDFGLSLWSDENDQVQMTATGATLGTPAYVAPEQLEDTHVDGRADIYALGATLFHMLTGKTPYADVSPIKAILAKTSGDDAWRQEIKDYCQPISADLIFAMTETRVEDRVSGYAELMGRIDAVLGQIGDADATRSSLPQRTVRATSKPHRRRLLATVGFLAAGGAIGIGWATWPSGEDRSAVTKSLDLGDFQPRGLPRPLFNGLGVPLFRKSGVWLPRKSADGSRVLAAGDNAQMNIPVTTASLSQTDVDWRFRVSVQPQADAEAIVELVDSTQRPMLTLRLGGEGARLVRHESHGEAALLGRLDWSEDEENSATDDFDFRQCIVARLGDSVLVTAGGEQLGVAGASGGSPQAIVLRAIGGEVFFADLDIVELRHQSPE